tara:strand:+ start:434 stop:793 length:360 start_codon:yes stop_codon:yes gene_type:complete
MLKKINKLEKQTGGGGIPFSSLKTTTKTKKKKSSKKKKRTISPSRQRRKITKKTKRSKKKTLKETKEKMCQCGSHTYSTKENSPDGLGKCSVCLPINVAMRGKDNKLYENTKDGWVKIN